MSAIIVLILRLFLAICLYAFLGWTFLTLWRDLRHQSLSISSRQIPAIQIGLVYHDQIDRRRFTGREVAIGRDAACDLMIQDETVSARHARLNYHHNQWWIEDLQSTNGTFINEERVVTPTVIISGDELRCGRIGLLVSIGEESGSGYTEEI